MKTKKIIIILSSITFIIILIALTLPFFIPTSWVEPQIKGYLFYSTGNDVDFKNLSMSLLPSPRIVLDDLVIKDPERDIKMLTAKNLDIIVKLLPLLRKKIVIEELIVIGATLNYTMKTGNSNKSRQQNDKVSPSVQVLLQRTELRDFSMHVNRERLKFSMEHATLITKNIDSNLIKNIESLTGSIIFDNTNIKLPSLNKPIVIEKGKISLSNGTLNSDTLALSIPGSRLHGTIDCSKINSTPFKINMRTSYFDLNEFLESLSRNKGVHANKGNNTNKESRVKKIAILSLYAKKLKSKKTTMRNASLNTIVYSNRIAIHLLKGEIAEGNVKSRGMFYFASAKPSFKLEGTLSKINIELLQKYFLPKGKKAFITGFINGIFKLKGFVSNELNPLDNIQGNGSFILKNGIFKTINMNRELAKFASIPIIKKGNILEPKYRYIKGPFSIRHGKITTTGIDIETTLFKIFLKGFFIPGGNIKMTGSATLRYFEKSSSISSAIKSFAGNFQNSLSIPFLLEGMTSKPVLKITKYGTKKRKKHGFFDQFF